jgi:hypothetical protein
MNERPSRSVCLGLRARTARAIAIVVSGTAQSPCAIARAEITLGNPDSPALFGPYHGVMHLPWNEAVVAVQGAERAIETVATHSLEAYLRDLRKQDIEVTRVAVVGAPERKLETMGSPHISAHAAEGVLFRRVWQVAAAAIGVPSVAFAEKGFEAHAALRLELTVGALRDHLTEFGRAMGHPWRSDEKAAAMAAWLTLGTGSA